MYEDKTLVCKECGKEFVFTAGEQEFYAERGFQNEPQRCKACRDARKNAARGPREYLHRHLRCLRRRGPRALRAQERPSGLLQRLLRQDARERLIADSVDCKSGCPPRWTAAFYFKSGISPPAHSHRPCAGCRWRRRYSRISGSRSPQWRPAWRGYPRGCPPAHSRKGRCRS